MAQDQAVVNCAADAWTQLTNADATTITFQVVSGSVKVRATTDGTAPSDGAAGFEYHADPANYARDGELRILISDLASATGMVRLWAWPLTGRPAKVVVDHA